MRRGLFKKLLSAGLTVTLVMGLSTGSLTAAETGNEGKLKVSLATDKASYVNGEDISSVLTLNNEFDSAVSGIELSFSVPEGYSAKTTASVNDIEAGGKTDVKVLIQDTDKTDVYVVKQKASISDKFNTSENIKKYKVDNKNASVSKKGVFKAKKAGEVTVTALSDKGDVLGEYSAIIEKPVFKAITLEGGVSSFNALDRVSGISKAGVTKWTSSKPGVAEIDPVTGAVTVKKGGKTNLIAEFGTGKNAAKYKMKLKVPKNFGVSEADAGTASIESSEGSSSMASVPATGSGAGKKAKKGKATLYSGSNRTETVEKTVIIDGREKQIKVTVKFNVGSTNGGNDNENNEENGNNGGGNGGGKQEKKNPVFDKLLDDNNEVVYDGSGNVSFFEGNLSDIKVQSKKDALDVLNSIGALYALDTDDDDGIGGVELTEDDLDSVSEYEDGESGKKLYRYEPSVEGIPVVGSQVILSVDKETGSMTGLFSSFNKGLNLYGSEFNDYDPEEAKNAIVQTLLEENDISNSLTGDNKAEVLAGLISLSDPPEKVYYAASGTVSQNNNDFRPFPAYKVIITGTIGTGADNLILNRAAYVYMSAPDKAEVLAVEDLLRHDLISPEVNNKVGNDEEILKNPGDLISLAKENGITVRYESSEDENGERRSVAEKLLAVLNTTKNRYNGTLQEDIFKRDINVTCRFGAGSLNAWWDSSDTANVTMEFRFRDAGNTTDEEIESLAGHEFSHAMIGRFLDSDSSFLINHGETRIVSEAYADIIRDLMNGVGVGEVPETQYSGINSTKDVLRYAAYKMMSDSRTAGVNVETWKKIFFASIYRLPSDANLLSVRNAVVCEAKEVGNFDDPMQQAVKEAFDAAGIKAADVIRIVLTWGEHPEDMDSHLIGPDPKDPSKNYHVWYTSRSVSLSEARYGKSLYAADLDYDDTESYGPEITTIYKKTPGTYYFIVHDFTTGEDSQVRNSTVMAGSGSMVRLYYGKESFKLQDTFNINPGCKGTFWYVFKMTISNDGDISVTGMNEYDVPAGLRQYFDEYDEDDDDDDDDDDDEDDDDDDD